MSTLGTGTLGSGTLGNPSGSTPTPAIGKSPASMTFTGKSAS